MSKKEKGPIGAITLQDGTKKYVLEKKGKFFVCEDAQYFVRNYRLEKTIKEPKEEKKGVNKND